MFWKKKDKAFEKIGDFERKIIDDIAEHGFSANHVFDPEGLEPNFSYSIGFESSLGCPDFIIFGFNKNLAHNMLWEIYHQIKAGIVPTEGMEWSNLLEGDYICVSRLLNHSNHKPEFMSSSIWYSKYLGKSIEDFSAFQMVWPGTKDKKLPWEEGCHQSVIDAQTPLWLPSQPC